ncbi:hypothetical protein L226DRAFT_538966, partial [Lentinus tigrinus ALCF2SS1-7]|uniref:uncharacterized protein n=1 Tax=Lentinus tigrinus ALCF2SS1-7 TaxID=1328758 RepID=UPI001165E06D
LRAFTPEPTSINMAATLPYHSSLRPRTCVLPSRPRDLTLLCPDMTAEQARRHPTGETVTMALYVDSQGVSHPSSLLSTGACAFETTRYSTCS